MSDITYWSDEYKRELDQFSALVTHARGLQNSANTTAVQKALKDCDEKADRLKNVKNSFKLELRLVKDKEVKAEFEALQKKYDERAATLTKDLQDMRDNKSKAELFGGKVAKSSAALYSTDGKTNDDLLSEANLIQDKTFDSLARTRQQIEDTKDVGRAALDQLYRQRDQIQDIEKDVDIMDTNLKRAQKLVLNFTRRMATDRIFQAFAALNIGVMLALILYVVISGKSLSAATSNSNGGSSLAPPPAATTPPPSTGQPARFSSFLRRPHGPTGSNHQLKWSVF